MPRLTPRQAAEYAGVSPGLVYLWCSEKVLPHMRLGQDGRRGRIFIEEDDLKRFLQTCRVERHHLLPELPST